MLYNIFLSVNAVDDQAPQILNCPQSITETVPIGTPVRPVFWTEPTGIDNSMVPPTIVKSHDPGQSFNVGTTTVTYIFFDGARNEAICTFDVTGKSQFSKITAFMQNCSAALKFML